MKHALVRVVVASAIIVLGGLACRQGDPLEPKTPPNSPVPTKLDRPDDSPASPSGPSFPKLTKDAGS
jgi:hypothetical protein